ncbi:MAG TPA: heme exporter protein CcmB [Gammaproteobacteria bacterium]|nr:heme exporter protein CcmB [Gammaproteobacteria bacterium]
MTPDPMHAREASTANALLTVVRRDLLAALRKPGQIVNPLLFYVLAVSLFPLGVGPSPTLLLAMASGVVWVCALLAVLLALETLFRADYEDGGLELLALSPVPLPMLALAKILAHWLLTGLPLIVLSPLLGMLLALPEAATGILVLTLALGTPVLSLIGAIGAALTLAVRSSGALLALLVLPLYIPVLIFAAGAVNASMAGLPFAGPLYFLAALLALALTLAPPAVAAAIRINLQ